MAIKNIVFDVGMVLIDFCWEKVCVKLGFDETVIRHFDVDMIHSGYWAKLDEGVIGTDDAIAGFIQAMPQYEKEIRCFWEHAEEFVEEYDYAAPMIAEIKRRGCRVYLLSNYPEDMYKMHWPTFRFYNLVDGYVVSAPNRLAKPNPAIYHLLLSTYGLKAEECLFFDDRRDNVEAAVQVGMQAVLFEGYDTVRKRLDLKGYHI